MSAVPVFSQDLLDARGFPRKLKRDLEDSCGHIFDHGFGRARQIAQQVAGFGEHGFAGDERRIQIANGRSACVVILLAAIKQRHDDAGIEEYRLQRPKLRRCFLSEPRSGRPEQNFPRPMTPRFFFRK